MAINNNGKAIKEETGSMVSDVAGEVKHEVHNIRYVKEPVDPTHTDTVVRRHVTGLSISFFVGIVLFLIAVIIGVALYQHGHRAGPTTQTPASSLALPSAVTGA